MLITFPSLHFYNTPLAKKKASPKKTITFHFTAAISRHTLVKFLDNLFLKLRPSITRVEPSRLSSTYIITNDHTQNYFNTIPWSLFKRPVGILLFKEGETI